MSGKINKTEFKKFKSEIEGEYYSDFIHSTIYATDASAYKENPIGVLIPANTEDVKKAIAFANKNNLNIIPRTAGTSIAGQVVGAGMVIDCSKYLNKILEINKDEKWVRVQPGVVLDELNKVLEPYSLFFGPETSTSNRCMIGGMVGNNSCGAHSLIYGSTRDHTLELKTILSDGSEAVFGEITSAQFEEKCSLKNLEGNLYRSIKSLLENDKVKQGIAKEFPDEDIERRNTGYAIDLISKMNPLTFGGKTFNFCSLLCGSEGTLAFITEIKLNLVSLPPKNKGLLVVHHNSLQESFEANLVALEHKPVAIELIDKFLLDCTKTSAEHSKNRFFIEGDPEALLCIEFADESKEIIEKKSNDLINAFRQRGFGYHFPLLFDNDINRVWALRKAGLGLLSNIPGDAKPQPVIEDTAVSPRKLPAYINEFNEVLHKNGLNCVYYAHIATGELHLRPIINLKDKEGVRLFRLIATEIARLVKKYGGSLSGEHGDGRLRGEFIPFMIGKENYTILQEIKKNWDPGGIFNPGKITDTPPMDTSLRFTPGKPTPEFETIFDFSESNGYIRMAEKCNGSADCRKSAIIGGTMCPSYQATRDEQTTTRARANMLREVINGSNQRNRFNNKELFDVLDLCLSCKGCKTECPSGVDMAKLKSEFLYHYYKSHIIPLRSRLVASFSVLQSIAIRIGGVYNYLISNTITSKFIKRLIGFATERSLPKVNRISWRKWVKQHLRELNNREIDYKGEVCLFIDEFTNYNEAHIGIVSVKFLSNLGYKIKVAKNNESGRAKISKGFLRQARKLAEQNVVLFDKIIDSNCPLVGIEPSAILCFRDEYPELLRGELQKKARKLNENVLTIEEFIYKEFNAGKITSDRFTTNKLQIKYHGHCQQKALTGTQAALEILTIPKNFTVTEIKSGCCGMAGSFGYEKEHFKLSMQVGELVLFPEIRKSSADEIIVAPGTSCRHHIKDGTGNQTKHPVEVLYESLK